MENATKITRTCNPTQTTQNHIKLTSWEKPDGHVYNR